MFSLNEPNSFMVYGNSVDLRKGVEPLCGIARMSGMKPSDGAVYVFLNRSRTLMKLLHWDGMGVYGLVFFYEKGSRGGKVIRPKLLHRRAAIQSDGYTVYENIEKSQMEGIVTLYCMAHARSYQQSIVIKSGLTKTADLQMIA